MAVLARADGAAGGVRDLALRAARGRPRPDARVDWLGAALLSVALAALLYGLSKANAWGWGSPRVLALIARRARPSAAFWVWVETKVDQPLVDMRVLRRRPVLMTNITAVLVGFSMFASFLLIPQLAQTPERFGYGFGASVTGAGLLMLPSTLVMLVAGPFAGRLATRANSRLPLVIGTFFGMLAFLFYALFHGSEWEICVGGALLGVGIGFSASRRWRTWSSSRSRATRSASPPASTRSCARSAARSARSWWPAC